MSTERAEMVERAANTTQSPDDPASAYAEGSTNSLGGAASAYLRSAMHQPVDWMEWSEAAFARAAAEDKPILLDIGAVWCHWCHVMDRESYEDAATATIVNQHFVAIKVDRDERPDVDTRYQAAVSSISGQGGWPLTAFLTPEGKPYFGGTYFPPEDRHGRPSFQRVLLTMAEAFHSRRAEVDESAGSVMDAIEQNESFSSAGGDLGEPLVHTMLMSALKSVDWKNGGFGSQPKFPHSSALDLLIDAASRSSKTVVTLPGQASAPLPEVARRAVEVTLERMSKGGIYDHLAGGFHRYSVDNGWRVPHFEKMAYDNSELLKNYVHAFQTFGDPMYADVARDIMRWMNEWLTDREQGGFYASQDADFSLEDDGDYFTWSCDEVAEVLTFDENVVASMYYDIAEIGDMQHNVAKNVLHVSQTIDTVARKAGILNAQAEDILARARRKLSAARKLRPTPYVDRTIYVAWNAMCISAYLAAGRILGTSEACSFALKTLDRVLATAWSKNSELGHVVAYGEQGGTTDRVPGGLDDYVFLAHAALDAWESTGRLRYYEAASDITKSVLMKFYDPAGCGGFFDTPRLASGERRLGALGARRKPLQDSPTPAGNPVAVSLLLRMQPLNGRPVYTAKARQTLESFAGVVEHYGLYAATYGLALRRLVEEPLQVCVIGEDSEAHALETEALRRYVVGKSVVRLRPVQLGALPPSLLPPMLQKTLPHLPKVRGSFAVVCTGDACLPPVTTVTELRAQLERIL